MRAGKRLRPLPISPPSDEQESISNTNPVHRVHPFLVPEPVVDWGPPTRVDRVLARFRDFFLASGPWGWVGYAVLAVFKLGKARLWISQYGWIREGVWL